jgi:hypothetical protein
MEVPIVLIGVGELGGVFARGALRCGHPVYPVTRGMNIKQEYRQIPDPALVLVTVGENDLHPVLEHVPEPWRNKLGLLQNELLPRDWQRHNLQNPTITVVWFEKKKGMDLTNVLYTSVYGPQAPLLARILEALEIPVRVLVDEDELLYEMMRKTVYILTVNIAGLITKGTVEDLWYRHQDLARAVAEEVITLQESLTRHSFSREKLITGMVEGIDDCPHRMCVGRSAVFRLQRALQHAREEGLGTPKLAEIYQKVVE